ncbi:transcription termination factor NusA [Patescibacteria group bacterium]|nr:transcription termination factor NusA [Patescibacteria group bacterium]MBU1730139.1 transcription termination factor NusA [Patescibacteria group bacterium]MBU1956109.1 transcription termination factor NusA [Patescibacteria group bacterium]MBU2010278.1 transcription termination factor NusA [Patescibacteria group bacterium]MBU2416935.1 transcription termination factor NusA [Patescibacteria group bacterium]
MIDLKTIQRTLSQLEEERGIPREKVIEAIEYALAAAYKKDYGKKGQFIRAKFNLESGQAEFYQIKIAVEPNMLRLEEEESKEEELLKKTKTKEKEQNKDSDEEDALIRFNPEHHIMIDDAQKIKKDIKAGEEVVFSLETHDDYGRIAAQTAKQVIIQRIREAEKVSALEEYGKKQGEIINGIVQRVEYGNIFVDMGKTTGILSYDEQIRGERFKQGDRIQAFLFLVEDTPRGINLKLSRSHPKFLQKLFEMEVPEITTGVVEIKSIAREAGSRSKIAVVSHEDNIDPVGSCVGQRGVRVSTVMSELGGEKIDIIEWSADPVLFIEDALSPAKIRSVTIDKKENKAIIEVQEEQLSLAIGAGGQNVRLAAKLTGWKMDIRGVGGQKIIKSDEVVQNDPLKEESVDNDKVNNTDDTAQETTDDKETS